jgi:hypothetical protein
MIGAFPSDDDQRPFIRRSRYLLLLILVATCGHALPGQAHGDAEWIMNNPEYVDRLGLRCCGPEDCERIPESYIREDGLNIHVLPTQQIFQKGHPGVYQSRDSSWWWCKSKPVPWLPHPSAACIFFPFRGY